MFFISVLMVSVIVSFIPCVSYFCTCTPSIIRLLTFQMTSWSFRDALAELKVRGHSRWVSVVEYARFTYGEYSASQRYRPPLRCARCPSAHFCNSLQKGSFNPDNLPVDSYSHTMAILLAFIPDPHLMDIERVGIGNVI